MRWRTKPPPRMLSSVARPEGDFSSASNSILLDLPAPRRPMACPADKAGERVRQRGADGASGRERTPAMIRAEYWRPRGAGICPFGSVPRRRFDRAPQDATLRNRPKHLGRLPCYRGGSHETQSREESTAVITLSIRYTLATSKLGDFY